MKARPERRGHKPGNTKDRRRPPEAGKAGAKGAGGRVAGELHAGQRSRREAPEDEEPGFSPLEKGVSYTGRRQAGVGSVELGYNEVLPVRSGPGRLPSAGLARGATSPQGLRARCSDPATVVIPPDTGPGVRGPSEPPWAPKPLPALRGRDQPRWQRRSEEPSTGTPASGRPVRASCQATALPQGPLHAAPTTRGKSGSQGHRGPRPAARGEWASARNFAAPASAPASARTPGPVPPRPGRARPPSPRSREFLLLGERGYYFLVVITSCKNSLASESVTIAQWIVGFLERAPLLGFLQGHLCPPAAAGTLSPALGRPPSSAFRTSIRFASLPLPWGPAPVTPGSRHSFLIWGEVGSLLQHQQGLGQVCKANA
ncbi:collagen alpha-1(I) chain-like [Rousettus aegyptiacus]|uniref:collagen alpha-1(I) chain-like n=1 Tax=Rousettus aegyptiacus TaxID=9407 RepID=UPI00168D5A11|nr:collagen alpha-1(I) chain-like [Rousettus aegyptiacus]